MLYSSLPGLAASIVILTLLLIAPTYSLLLLVYIYFALAAMPYQLKVLTFYHILSHKVISKYVTKVLH